jgi:hypothetical protein
MNKDFYLAVNCGLMFIGLWLILMDVFATKLGDLRPGLKPRNDKFYGIGDHRFRRGGYVVICIAIAGFIALLIIPPFDQFPPEAFVLKVSDLILGKIRAPWGEVSVFAGILSLAIGVFLLLAGVEHWRLRQNHIRAVLCFALGLVILAEGIIQWG